TAPACRGRLPPPFSLPPHYHDRAVRIVNHVVCHAADQNVGEAGIAVGTEDDQAGCVLLSPVVDHRPRTAAHHLAVNITDPGVPGDLDRFGNRLSTVLFEGIHGHLLIGAQLKGDVGIHH